MNEVLSWTKIPNVFNIHVTKTNKLTYKFETLTKQLEIID